MADLYTAKDYSHLLGLSGFSDTLLENHFSLYQGYVKNTNLSIEKLRGATIDSPEYAEMQRRFGWEWNGMRLHEFYFGNMSKEAAPLESGALQEKLVASFGSLEAWQKNFESVGAMRGIGWALLVQDPETGELFNTWINEHDLGHLAGARPLLVMDVFEHAFMIDYGVKRADYLAAFMRAIDWKAVEERFAH